MAAAFLDHLSDVTSSRLAGQRQALDRDGFVILPGVIDADWLARLRLAVDRLAAAEGELGGREVHTEGGTQRLSDLVNKDPVFDDLWTHPMILACVAHVLARPFKLSSLNAREALPGSGHQGLHGDWGAHEGCPPWHVVNSLWLLDDLGPANGGTRLVPGSHRRAGTPAQHLVDPSAAHPDEIIVTAPAGSVVVINAHTWHGGTRNVSGARRRVVHAYFTASEHPQQLDQRRYLRPETSARLSPAALDLLDVRDGFAA